MAKKKTKTKTAAAERRDIVKICAFWGLAISAIMYVTSGLITFIVKLLSNIDARTAGVLGQISGIASLVASIALAVAIALPAYSYVRGKNKNWKIFYWVVLSIYVLGIVFGLVPAFL